MTCLHRPLPASGYCLKNRELQQRFAAPVIRRGRTFKELEDLFDTFTGRCAYKSHRSAKLRSQGRRIHLAATAAQVVCHVQNYQRGQVEAENGYGERKMSR